MPKIKPIIETHYELFKWNEIWRNLSSVFIMVNEREILYKYLHEILPTNKRLRDIRSIVSPLCEYCTEEESNIHFVYQCQRHTEVIQWLKSTLQKYCELSNPKMIELCFLQVPKLSKKAKNTTLILISTFIVSMWLVRKSNMSPTAYKRFIKGKVLNKQRMYKYILGENMENLLTRNFCNMKATEF